MSYCLNPECKKPQNPPTNRFCQTCGKQLLLKSRYRPVKLIGQGGFGRTFLAIDQDIPSRPYCVIKQLFPEMQGVTNLEKATKLFELEATQLDQLGKHPQIPQLLAHFEQDQQLYLIQEYIQGPNLATELSDSGPFTPEQIIQLLESLLPVLQFVHQHHVIHRDIKPENIIRRSQDQQLCLVDFGAAKLAQNGLTNRTGTVIGTPGYLAPEQSVGKAIFASDIYSLGVTCLHLLTQIEPLDLFDTAENSWAWRDYLLQPMDRNLALILDKMVAIATNQRYSTPQQVLEDLKFSRPRSTIPLMSNNAQVFPRLVEIENSYGYINPLGQMVTGLQFEEARAFSAEGLAAVRVGRKWGFINQTGKLVIPIEYTEVSDFAEGLAAFRLNKWYRMQAKWGYLNPKGEIVIEPQFQECGLFCEGLAAVRQGLWYGFIDPTGKMVIPPQFLEVGNFSQGLARVRLSSKWGYINNQGNIVIPPRDNARDFSENLAAVEINGLWGYINCDGVMVIQPEYKAALDFQEGFAPVLLDVKLFGLLVTGQKWGYIDTHGVLQIEPQFDWGYSFREGLAAVKKNERWGYINKLGQMVIEPRYDLAGEFHQGIAEVMVGTQYRYINKRGQLIY